MTMKKAEVALFGGSAPAGEAEQWETGRDGGRIVRNVVCPTLTPVLPESSKATGTGVLLAPGGGFRLLAIDGEGFEAAEWLAERGVAAFVLKYRTAATPRDPKDFAAMMAAHHSTKNQSRDTTPDYSAALEDVRAALFLLRTRADEWGIAPGRLGMMGFSAGAMATLDVALGEGESVRPNFIAPIYGPMAARPVPPEAPPMFAMMAADDPYFATGGLELLAEYRKAGRPAEFHWYEQGGHAFGVRQQGFTCDLWAEQFLAWLRMRGLMEPCEPPIDDLPRWP